MPPSGHILPVFHLQETIALQGGFGAKPRNAERYTALNTETCGAPPAAGKRPVRDSLTESFFRLMETEH